MELIEKKKKKRVLKACSTLNRFPAACSLLIPGIAHFEPSYLLWPPAGHGYEYK